MIDNQRTYRMNTLFPYSRGTRKRIEEHPKKFKNHFYAPTINAINSMEVMFH